MQVCRVEKHGIELEALELIGSKIPSFILRKTSLRIFRCMMEFDLKELGVCSNGYLGNLSVWVHVVLRSLGRRFGNVDEVEIERFY